MQAVGAEGHQCPEPRCLPPRAAAVTPPATGDPESRQGTCIAWLLWGEMTKNYVKTPHFVTHLPEGRALGC